MKKIYLIVTVLVLCFVTGCSSREEKYPNALKVGSEEIPKTLNPYSSSDSANLYISGHIYDSLLGAHVVPFGYEEGKDYFFEDGTKYNPVDINDNYYLFEDGLVKKDGAYPRKEGSEYGFVYYTPTTTEYNEQLKNKKIEFGLDELGNQITETQEQFEKRRDEAVPLDNWMEYRFEVDKRYTWNDGVQFTAKDIVFTFKYALAYPGELASIAFFLNNYIDCYEENGDFVLKLATNKLSDIKTICNSILIVPSHIWNDISNPNEFSNLSNPIGTGPYKLVKDGFIADSSVALEFRDDYNSELTKEMFAYDPIEHIFLAKLYTEEIMLSALDKGDIDVTLNSFTVTKINSLKNTSSYKNLNVVSSPSSFVSTLVMNVGKNGIFSDLDIEVREAISLAIDQEDLIKNYLYGEGKTVGNGLVTKDSVHALKENDEYVEHEFNIEKANELLDVKYPKNSLGKRDLNFTILGEIYSETLINTLCTMLNKNLGINVSFELSKGSDYSESIKQRNNPDFDMIVNNVAFNIEQLLMFDARFGVYSDGSPRVWNFSGYSNEELSTLMNKMDTASNIEEQLHYCSLVQQGVANAYVEIPLYSSMVYSIYQEQKFTGWVQTSTGTILNSLSMKYIKIK